MIRAARGEEDLRIRAMAKAMLSAAEPLEQADDDDVVLTALAVVVATIMAHHYENPMEVLESFVETCRANLLDRMSPGGQG